MARPSEGLFRWEIYARPAEAAAGTRKNRSPERLEALPGEPETTEWRPGTLSSAKRRVEEAVTEKER